MDAMNSWKKILLQWIKECNFLEKTFYSIDQTEIDTFFQHFKDHFKETLSKHQNISSFLKDQYPFFEPHFDDENVLSSSDHIYVYSLLLHYSCVKCPQTFFQENCQKLNESSQHNITTFFQKLLEEVSLTKETLRRVIASINLFTPPTARLVYSDSPLKTPNKSGISPPTPRSCMLQERNRTVHSLKAELATVSYEKSVLETDLRNHHDRILKLKQELKKSHQEIVDLRNEMLSKDTESDCEKHSGEEQINRKFAKQIALKEAEIAKLNDNIEVLTDQKEILNEKLKTAEKRMKCFQNDIDELSQKLEDLSEELDKKETTIKSLSDEKNELELYISEIRSSTCDSRRDLNTSSDFIELSRATNSSGSIHSPENLGSVVDIKLREKEQENENLREEIFGMRVDNSKLSNAIKDLTLGYSQHFDIRNENLVFDQESSDPANSFLIFSNYMKTFGSKYEEKCSTLNLIQNEVDELRKETKVLTLAKTSLEKELKDSQTKFENCLKERSEEANNVKNLQKELQTLKSTHNETEKNFGNQIEQMSVSLTVEKEQLKTLQQDFKSQTQTLRSLEAELVENKAQNSNLVSQVEKLKTQETEYKQEIKVLNDKLDESLKTNSKNNERLQQCEMERKTYEEKIADLKSVEEALLKKVDDIEKQNTNVSTQLEETKQNYSQLLSEKCSLQKSTEECKERISSLQMNIQTVTSQNSEQVAKLEADKEVLIGAMQSRIDGLTKSLEEFETKTQKLNEQNAELVNKLDQSEGELNTRQKRLEEVSSAHDKLQQILSERTNLIQSLVTDLRNSFGTIMRRNNIETSSKSCEFDGTEDVDNQLTSEMKCLNEDLTKFENAYNSLTKENASLRQNLSELSATADNLRKNISQLETERGEQLERSKKTEAELNNRLTAMGTSQKQLEADTVELLEKYRKAEVKVSELQVKIVDLEKASEATRDTVQQNFEETKLKLESEVGEKLKIEEELKNATSQIRDYESKVVDLESKLQQNVEEALKNGEGLRKQIESTNLELDNELTEKIQIQKELESVKVTLEKSLKKNCLVEEKLGKVKLQLKEVVTAKQEIEKDFKTNKLNFENELRKIECGFDKMKFLVESQAAEKQQVEQKFESVKLQLETEVSEKQKLHQNLEILKDQLEIEATEKQQLKENFESLNLQFEKEVSVKRELQKDLESLKLQFESESTEKHHSEASEKLKLKEDLENARLQLQNENTEKLTIQKSFEEARLQFESKAKQIKEELEDVSLQLQTETTAKLTIQKSFEEARLQLETKESQIKEELETVSVKLQNEITEKNQIKMDLQRLKRQLQDKTKQEDELKEKIFLMESEIDTINEAASRQATEQREHLELTKEQLEKEVTSRKQLTADFENTKKELNDLRNQKIVLETNLEAMTAEVEKRKTDLRLAETEVNRLKCEEVRLLSELELAKSSSETELQKCNKYIEEQKENNSRLNEELECIRLQKERLEDERNTLKIRLDENLERQRLATIDHSSVLEKLQSAEKESFVKQTVLKAEQAKTKDLESQLKQLQMENTKLKDTVENNVKRIEKQALNLGETQGKYQKLRREADLAQSALAMHKSSMETLQRDNSRTLLEYKSLKDKLFKSERTIDQLELKIQILEQETEKLRIENKNQEISESDLKITNSSLEKIKSNLEEKLRKLAKSLSESNVAISHLEQDKVQLHLEVGGLNKQLQETKSLLNMKLKEVEDITLNMIETKNKNLMLIELNEKQQADANELLEENSRLNDQLSKLTLRLKLTQESHESAKTELEKLRSDILATKQQRDAMERDHRSTMERLVSIEGLYEETRSNDNEFLNKIESLEEQLSKTTIELRSLDESRNKDKTIIQQLNDDISIFKAKLQKSRSICEENDKKWTEEKERLLAEVRESEDRIKETRLELEGKLEKMKNKMKTLYNDEITKMKKKQERELAVVNTDLDASRAKNEKHEEHIKKLSNQIFRLNENILEYQKENTFLKTKLKDLESKPRQLSRVKSSSGIAASSHHQVLSSNLHMEDEEGEVFNNTYLSDLKNGRMSEHFNTDICSKELQYRNSLLPPHLKSTYQAQYDHQMGEDEIRDAPCLDDSMSTLLNTGQRKKMSGATSYKRPGPPTPSKNAGRLSFGGIGELNREILKESLDMGNGPSSSKTPAKFKLFSSRLSMRDEQKNHVTAFMRKQHLLGNVQCSSTPRKSKAHCDQRRLLDQIMLTASPGSDYASDCIVSPTDNLPSSLKGLELTRRMSTQKWRQPKLTYATDSGNSDVNSPKMKEFKKSTIGCRPPIKRLKDRRGSIYLRGSMFARNARTPTLGVREVFKRKCKMQRNANFNKYRNEKLNELLIKRPSLCYEFDTNDSNSNCCSLEEIDMNKHVVEKNSFCDENEYNDNSCERFNQLLAVKESNAPFEISEIKSGPSSLHINNSSSNVHSRTIYGTSVILNRRIPNVSTTMVRKSSIYVKAQDGQSLILVTNQTITLMDLAQMWIQMNVSAKSFITLSFVAMFIGICSLTMPLFR